ncbi:MAG: glycoside hydrolase family 127 protein [Pirellulaceae bacterium]
MPYTLVFWTSLAMGLTVLLPPGISAEPAHRQLEAVPFTAVKVRDAFWAPRLQINREKSLPHNFKWCEETGRFSNFAKAAGLVEGKFEGIYFNDSDVYKVLEGASYSLADHPDPELDRMTDDVIAKIAAAQRPNGYLNTYYTLVEPGKEWTDCGVKHELYCAGHLIEGAVAHFRATGKRTLLDVAIKFADHIHELFGPGKKVDVPGHEELELALVKLYEVTGEPRYFELSQFFLNARGNPAGRARLYGEYCQDHRPVAEQQEIVGHAVRAMYLYAGVADVAAYSGDAKWIAAMNRLWDDVVGHKLYITGGIGARHEGEAFGNAYELPNESAYCETCAAIGLALWAHRLNLLHGDAQFADVLERVIYNGVLSGIGMDGEHFFYVNPLAADGNHHRQPFYPCACCPTNVVRFLPSLPGYIYATSGDSIYVNLYVAGEGEIKFQDMTVSLRQETRYPWDGQIRLTVKPQHERTFDLHLRIPQWCSQAQLTVNGSVVASRPNEKGYVVLHRTWQAGDQVELHLPMEVQRIEAHPLVVADAGRVALQRGPLVYCFEAVDNDGHISNIVLDHDPKFEIEPQADLLGGITLIRAQARGERQITAIPYYAWDHREPGAMLVWVRQDGKLRAPQVDDPSWKGRLYRVLDPTTLGPSQPPELSDLLTPSASHCWTRDSLAALADGREPKSSHDETIPRFTWWDHRGTSEWVQVDAPVPVTVRGVEVYWFDDQPRGGGCRVPRSWKLLYRQGDTWTEVANPSPYGTARDQYNRTTFDEVTTTGLRIVVVLQPDVSGGILEWEWGVEGRGALTQGR